MSLASTLAAFVLALVTKEAPNVRTNVDLRTRYETSISDLINIHEEVSDGRLVNHDVDVLLLTAVNYRESRLKNPSVDGDCHLVHALEGQPSSSWPKGYRPVYRQRCNAVGPMQLSRGNVGNLLSWTEVATEFSESDKNRFNVEDLRDPKTNIRIAYAELDHWKNECMSKGEAAPIGVWFTAYRYGHCPALSKVTGRYYIDNEAKLRCKLASDMLRVVTNDADSLPQLRCVY